MIEAVLFDLFETLVTERVLPVRRAGSLAAELGLDEAAYKREWRSRRPQIVLGRTTFTDTLVQIGSRLGRAIDAEALKRLRAERIAEKAAVLGAVEPQILAALAGLRRRRVKLGLVTNSFAEDVAGWGQSPLSRFFDVTVFSCDAGRMKPDPAIYLEACKRLDVMPRQALFVGDGSDNELTGARAAGLTTARALWFASRWPHKTAESGERGLSQIEQVLDVAAKGASA
jgi:putative hydrolase of the HAD superfamily